MKGDAAQGRLAANAGIWASATGCSRLLGLGRDLCIALLLGAGPMADAFFLAFRLPDLLRRLFGEGVWSMAFVPAYLRSCTGAEAPGCERGDALARSALVWLLLLVGGGCLLCMLLAPLFAQVAASGASPGERKTLDAAVTLFRVCAPYGLFVMAAALSAALLNAKGEFLAPALAPAILNTVLVLTALAGLALDVAPASAAYVLAWAVLLGGALQWLAQQPALRRKGFSWRGTFRLRDPRMARLGREALSVLAGVSCFQLCSLLATLLAAGLPAGSVSWLYFAERLAQLPLGLFSVAVSVAALPELASLAASGRLEAFVRTLRQGLGLALWCSLPAAFGLAALAEPIVALLFGHGAFDPEAVRGTARVVTALALGVPPLAATRPLAAACNARLDRRSPLLATLGGLAVFGLAAWPGMHWGGAAGLALAVSLAGWANAALLLAFMSRTTGREERAGAGLLQDAAKPAGATLALCLGVWAAGHGLGRAAMQGSGGWTLALVAGLAAVYVLGSLVLRVPAAVLAWGELVAALRRRRG